MSERTRYYLLGLRGRGTIKSGFRVRKRNDLTPAQQESEDVMGDVLPEIDAEIACSEYAKQVVAFPETMEMVVPTTVTREGKEAFLVFKYGTKRFKATFEQVNRVRKPKVAAPVA